MNALSTMKYFVLFSCLFTLGCGKLTEGQVIYCGFREGSTKDVLFFDPFNGPKTSPVYVPGHHYIVVQGTVPGLFGRRTVRKEIETDQNYCGYKVLDIWHPTE
jgi:hypothetical protein